MYKINYFSLLSLVASVSLAACGAGDQTDSSNTRPLISDALCPADSCTGTAPGAPNYECADGSLAGPACVESNGECGWQILECRDSTAPDSDPNACTIEECGVAPGAPNTLCSDGSLGGPACERNAEGTCGWIFLQCPPDDSASVDNCECAGPAPGAPNYLCPDGQSFAGPACVVNQGACNWEILSCPNA